MRCEDVLPVLADHVLGTLSEIEGTEIRRHLRGCGACRADALALDRGVAMFGSAAHAADPPPGLRERVLGALAEEWADADRAATAAAEAAQAAVTARAPGRGRGVVVRWLAAAAVVVALGGALAWGAVERSNADRVSGQLAAASGDAKSYRSFLSALGGKEVRVAKLHATVSVLVTGTAILYDSDRHESWGLFEINAPGYRQPLIVTLVSSSGETIRLPFPVQLDADGHGAGWLSTAADISSFRTVRVLAPDGTVLATGVTDLDH
jgi:Putative zinc-finger